MGKRGVLPKAKLPVASPSTEVYQPSKLSKEEQERQRRYKAEDALRDIERAEMHRKDKGLMSDVKALCMEKAQMAKKL